MYRRGWRDGILRNGASILAGLRDMPHWKKRLDLARLAVDIAQSRSGAVPKDCIREASELMLAASEEIEWMENGRFEESRRATQEWAEKGLVEHIANLKPADESDEDNALWKVLGLNERAPWRLFCWEGDTKPGKHIFPDGVEWEPYQRKESLRKLVVKVVSCGALTLTGVAGVNGFLQAAEEGRADMRDIYRLAVARANQPWDKRRKPKKPVSSPPAKNLQESQGK